MTQFRTASLTLIALATLGLGACASTKEDSMDAPAAESAPADMAPPPAEPMPPASTEADATPPTDAAPPVPPTGTP